MSSCQTYTIADCVNNYMLDRSISKKKYFASYMVMAKKEWQKLFRNTIWAVQSKWLTLKDGDPYAYIDVPANAQRIFSVAVEDRRCGLIQPLFYNNQLNIISKPTVRKCGCNDPACLCDEVCDSANSMSYTTKLLFTISGVDYYEKTWTEVCRNGDVLVWTETPTKKYNNTTGDAGDYNQDYNDDYDIASPPFSDFTIEILKRQKKICKLEVKPCGCPVESPENAELLTSTCGCQLNFGCGLKKRHCRVYDENINNNHLGEIKISECSTKIYYRPARNWRRYTDREFPEFLLISYQTNGLDIDAESLIPDYAIDCMETGINYRSKRFNSAIPQVEKQDAFYQYEMEQANLTMYLNPISLIELGKIQDEKILW